MSTDMEAQVRGIRDRQGFVLPHFYAEAHASAELVHRLKRASENIDTWTWKELCQQELEHVQFDEVKRTPEDSGQRLLYRQPGVRGELLKHLSALRKCLERVETIDDRSAESGSTWKSTELEGDIEAAGRALTFLCDMFGVGHGDV